MQDSQIIDLYWQRDESAISETDKKYGAYCLCVSRHILADIQDAEECVNDTWFHAWNSMPPQKPKQLRMFLAKITRNLSLDCWRRKNRIRRGGGEMMLALEELEECVQSTKDVETEIQAKELGRYIREFLDTLPVRECNVFLRRYFYIETVEEIAKRYQLRQDSVHVILSRTRKKLRRYLEKEGYVI